MPDWLLNPTGIGAILGGIGFILWAVGKLITDVGPKAFDAWVNARQRATEFAAEAQMRADENARTRSEANQMALTGTFGQIFEYLREDRSADREQRKAELKEAQFQREQNERLIKSISEMAANVGKADDRVRLLTQTTAQILDSQRRTEYQLKNIEHYMEASTKKGRP